MRGQRFRVRCADGFLSVPAPQKKLKNMSVLIVTSVYQAAAHAIVPGSDAHREASKARIPRSDKGSKSCAETVEDVSAVTMLTNAWTGDPLARNPRQRNSMSAFGGIRPSRQAEPRFQSKLRGSRVASLLLLLTFLLDRLHFRFPRL